MIQPLNLNQQETPAPRTKINWRIPLAFAGIIVLGVLSGYGFFSFQSAGPKKLKTEVSGTPAPGESYGIADAKTFPDSAEGEVAGGGIDGEGSHHLVRQGGESQYVYLTSSIIDLDQFVGRQVKVWGQTFEAQKAGWLMDVGRLEIVK